MGFHAGQQHLHHRQRFIAGQIVPAGGLVVPFEVEHWGQRVGLGRHIGREPGHLLMGRPAPIDEMIRAARNPRLARLLPVLAEFGVEVIAPVGRLDIGEARSGPRHGAPVDIALVAGDVDAVDGQRMGPPHAGMGGVVALHGIVVVAASGQDPDEREPCCQRQDRPDPSGCEQGGKTGQARENHEAGNSTI